MRQPYDKAVKFTITKYFSYIFCKINTEYFS